MRQVRRSASAVLTLLLFLVAGLRTAVVHGDYAAAAAGNCVLLRPGSAGVDFVTTSGDTLCLGGRPWYLHGATIYSGFDDPVGRTKLAQEAGLNVLRLVNFIDPPEEGADAFSETQWARLDRMISVSESAGLKVILDLSDYRNLLVGASINPYTTDWEPFLRFVANRRNTVTGVLYRDEPTIALISFAGEVEPINSPKNSLGVTTEQVTSFFRRTFAEWKNLDQKHLTSAGGLAQLDWPSGIDWQTIMTLPGSDVCTITIYGDSTAQYVPQQVSSLCHQANRPWVTEEFGARIAMGDARRSDWFQRVFGIQNQYGSAGEVFWNLGPQTMWPSFDVSPAEPVTWRAVQAHDTSIPAVP
jgi:mannan endo-1,4-beta-mannosidase